MWSLTLTFLIQNKLINFKMCVIDNLSIDNLATELPGDLQTAGFYLEVSKEDVFHKPVEHLL